MGDSAWLVAAVVLGMTTPSATSSVQLRSDLTLLQAAIEAHRGQHHWHYPSAQSPEALISLLKEEANLPDSFQPSALFTAFRMGPDGYLISVGTGSTAISIATPKRYEPFWSFLW